MLPPSQPRHIFHLHNNNDLFWKTQVAKDFVLQYEEKERQNADRLTLQVDRHITTLKTLRGKLEARHDLKTRTEEYRNWQKGFLPKKHAVMIGKTLTEYEASQPPKTANMNDPDDEIDDEAMRRSKLVVVFFFPPYPLFLLFFVSLLFLLLLPHAYLFAYQTNLFIAMFLCTALCVFPILSIFLSVSLSVCVCVCV
jgi:hypothetical protein